MDRGGHTLARDPNGGRVDLRANEPPALGDRSNGSGARSDEGVADELAWSGEPGDVVARRSERLLPGMQALVGMIAPPGVEEPAGRTERGLREDEQRLPAHPHGSGMDLSPWTLLHERDRPDVVEVPREGLDYLRQEEVRRVAHRDPAWPKEPGQHGRNLGKQREVLLQVRRIGEDQIDLCVEVGEHATKVPRADVRLDRHRGPRREDGAPGALLLGLRERLANGEATRVDLGREVGVCSKLVSPREATPHRPLGHPEFGGDFGHRVRGLRPDVVSASLAELDPPHGEELPEGPRPSDGAEMTTQEVRL